MFLDEINKLDLDFNNNVKMSLDINLIKIYKDFNKKIKDIENYNETLESDFDIDFFIKSYNYSKKMEKSIKNLKKLKKIKYRFNNTNVHINLYYNKFSKNNISRIINLINFNITLFESINNKTRDNVNINILLTNHKKQININKDNQLTKENINSGYTQFSHNPNENFIVIYRNEELLKVLTHEMIHLYDLHSHQRIHTKINTVIKNNNRFFSIYESYTEAFAIIFYTFYYSKQHNLDFKELLNSQVKFNYIQCAKLLYSQNIMNANDISNMNIREIKEETNAISYFLLKTCILSNLNKFKKLFNKNNGFELENKNRVIEFDNILIKTFKSEKNKFNKSLNLIKNNKLDNKIDNKLLKSFRMNILD